MPKVFIIVDGQMENVCRDAITFANSDQSDFHFYLFPKNDSEDSPLEAPSVEVPDALQYLYDIKKQITCEDDDMIISFYNGILKYTIKGVENLFCAGSRYDEEFPCTEVISLKYLEWDILEDKFDYDLQKHSILHLILCGIIGSYTHLEPHNDNGCILDSNNKLNSFNKKLKRGYYFCPTCYKKIEKEKYGNSILKLCESFKFPKKYTTIINNFNKSKGWFFTGFILPIIAGLIVEIISSGSINKFFKFFIDIFQ